MEKAKSKAKNIKSRWRYHTCVLLAMEKWRRQLGREQIGKKKVTAKSYKNRV